MTNSKHTKDKNPYYAAICSYDDERPIRTSFSHNLQEMIDGAITHNFGIVAIEEIGKGIVWERYPEGTKI